MWNAQICCSVPDVTGGRVRKVLLDLEGFSSVLLAPWCWVVYFQAPHFLQGAFHIGTIWKLICLCCLSHFSFHKDYFEFSYGHFFSSLMFITVNTVLLCGFLMYCGCLCSCWFTHTKYMTCYVTYVKTNSVFAHQTVQDFQNCTADCLPICLYYTTITVCWQHWPLLFWSETMWMTLGCTLCGQFQQFDPTDETDYSHPHTQLNLEVWLQVSSRSLVSYKTQSPTYRMFHLTASANCNVGGYFISSYRVVRSGNRIHLIITVLCESLSPCAFIFIFSYFATCRVNFTKNQV